MELISSDNGFELLHKNGNWVLKKEIGFSPVEMLAASIGACGAYVYEKILTNSHIEFEIEQVEISYERTETKPARPLSRVEITFSLRMNKAEQGKAERAIKLIAKNCPVMQSLDPEIAVVENLIFL